MKVTTYCEYCGQVYEKDWDSFQLTVEHALPEEHMEEIRTLLEELGYVIEMSSRKLDDTESDILFERKGGESNESQS